jgi:DmsE family decaheme c-type cytochrome
MRNISVAVAVVFLATAYASGQSAKPAPAKPAPKEYVGSAVCQACHDDIFNSFQKDPHQIIDTDKKRKREDHACESCHGPGSMHIETVSVDDILNPVKLTAARSDEICLGCHRNQPAHSGRIQTGHAGSRIACTSCHHMHAKEPLKLVARTTRSINEQCSACHTNIAAAFQRPYAHRIPQNAMSCTDCHNPHDRGNFNLAGYIHTSEPGCLTCHVNLKGPFTYEHAPMKTEGCQACHEPHGSANPKMLTRADVRFVCLECHANLPQQSPGVASAIGVVPPAFHDLRSPRYQNCTVCHQKIHGSHVDRYLTR